MCTTSLMDVIIVGSGFSGLYMLYRLRQAGFSARVIEAADGIGGTWYHNRYPGARCDIESMQYSYSFSEELQQEWKWSELYSSQPEILRYLNYVADKFDLRRDIQLRTRVTAAVFNENLACWEIKTDPEDRLLARFCVMATGCLSAARIPPITGLETFKGNHYHTAQWPHTPVDLMGHRVAIIGTGSSGIQSIPVIAEQAAHVFVFQRTPNFSIPTRNRSLDPEYQQWWKSNYSELRQRMLKESFAVYVPDNKNISALSVTAEEQRRAFEKSWEVGGVTFMLTFNDLFLNKEANDAAAEFVRDKIRTIVKNPQVSEILTAQDHPIGTKRICADTRYFETFNRENVSLIDIHKDGIDEIVPTGIRIQDKIYEVDDIVFATGFDAMTGALLAIDIQGRNGKTIQEKWAEGPRTYLGLMIAGFPNMFTITGPGSPSVLSNMPPAIEQHCDWIADCLIYLRNKNYVLIEPESQAEDDWVRHVHDIGNMTLFPLAKSWYVGANIDGKPKVFMPYVAGFHTYRQKCQDIVNNGYEGFKMVNATNEVLSSDSPN